MKKFLPSSIFCLLVVSFSIARSQTDSTLRHRFKLGVDLVSPIGAYQDSYYRFPLSYISSNLSFVFFGEYRIGHFGLKVPVRLPVSHIDLESLEPRETSWGTTEPYYGMYFMYDNQFEIGVKPVYYFNLPDELFQVFFGVGYYFGKHRLFRDIRYDYYLPDSFGEYTVYDRTEYEIIRTPLSDYKRYSILSGVQFQFANRIGFAFDLELFMGPVLRANSTGYSNYSTGQLYLTYGSTDGLMSSRRRGVRFGLYVTYQF